MIDRWPIGSCTNTNVKLKMLMQRFDLIDAWRVKHPHTRAFTWCNNSRSKQSRIDLWLVSRTLEDNLNTNILSTPLTDHKAIRIHIDLLPMSTSKIHNSYWKLNSSALKHETVTLKVKELIHSFWTKAKAERIYCKHWELLKFELGKFFRNYCSTIAKLNRAQEENIISTIAHLSSKSPDSLSVEESNSLVEYQYRLDELYELKAEGAFVRSRRRWLEEGELNSAYFFRLEKSLTKNNIYQLKIGNSISEDPKGIAKHCSEFYKNLYSSQFSYDSTTSFMDSLDNINYISASDKDFCDRPITLAEILESIKYLKVNKSPGIDGLTSELYQKCAKDLAPFLLEIIYESIKASFPPTLTQSLITLIPKPKKDLLLIDNWHPISLLNCDYKIIATIFAKRLQIILQDIIGETQSGFLKNRHISNNIRLVLDLLDYMTFRNEVYKLSSGGARQILSLISTGGTQSR